MRAKSFFISSVFAMTCFSLWGEVPETDSNAFNDRTFTELLEELADVTPRKSSATLSHELVTKNLSPNSQPDYPKSEARGCGTIPSPYRATVRHIEGKGIGYTKGYTSIDLFVAPPPAIPHRFVPFLDTRLHVFDNGRIATNVGLGLRYISSSFVYGINTYYDYRETHRQKYNQYSLGLEALGKLWDFRLSGYLPVGTKRSAFYNTKFGYFSGNSIFLHTRQEFAMRGLFAEAGIHIKEMEKMRFYGAFGPYYFERSGQNAVGGKVRLSGIFLDHIKVEASTSYDPVFHWIGQGELSFVIPFGPKRILKKKNDCSRALRLHERALQPVDRQEIIVVGNKLFSPVAINPATGLPWKVHFVNNTSHSEGTFESPYPTLLEAQNASRPGDILYILPGDGTDSGMNHGITLQSNQKLFGSSVANPIVSTLGPIVIPSLTTTAPLITNITGATAIITISDYCEVAGLNLTTNNDLDYGIVGGNPQTPTISVKSPLIRDNFLNMSAATQAGIGLSVSDRAVLMNNNVTTGEAYAGIWVVSPGSLNATLIGNTGATTGAHYGIFLNANNTLTATLSENTAIAIGTEAYGLQLYTNSGSIFANLFGNSGTGGVGGRGISLYAQDSIVATLEANSGIDSGLDSYGIELHAQTGSIQANLVSNRGSGGSGGAGTGIFLNPEDGSITTQLIENTGSAKGAGSGILLQSTFASGNQITATLSDNVGSAGNSGTGIFIGKRTSAGPSIITTNLSGNTGSGGTDGYGIWIGGHTHLTGTLSGNTGSAGTGGYGIEIFNRATGSTSCVNLLNNVGTPEIFLDNGILGTFYFNAEGNTPINTTGSMIFSKTCGD